MSEKPHKGKITDWTPIKTDSGFYIKGVSDGHPSFHGRVINTSDVWKYDRDAGEIETRNSRYTLIS